MAMKKVMQKQISTFSDPAQSYFISLLCSKYFVWDYRYLGKSVPLGSMNIDETITVRIDPPSLTEWYYS